MTVDQLIDLLVCSKETGLANGDTVVELLGEDESFDVSGVTFGDKVTLS